MEVAASALAAYRIACGTRMGIGARGWVRTTNSRIFDPPLYALSYPGIARDAALPHRLEILVGQHRRGQRGGKALKKGAARDHARRFCHGEHGHTSPRQMRSSCASSRWRLTGN